MDGYSKEAGANHGPCLFRTAIKIIKRLEKRAFVAASLFTQEYFNDPGQASWSLIALLFLWGLGWTGANSYMFSAILYTLPSSLFLFPF